MPRWTAWSCLLLACAPASAQEAPGGEPAAAATRCLAEAVYFEARGDGERSQEAVAHVVVNRTENPDFPDTVCEVVEQGCQFSYECDGEPETMAEPAERDQAIEVAREVLEGEAPDPTGGATYFHALDVAPDWADEFERTARIGGHVYYRD